MPDLNTVSGWDLDSPLAIVRYGVLVPYVILAVLCVVRFGWIHYVQKHFRRFTLQKVFLALLFGSCAVRALLLMLPLGLVQEMESGYGVLLLLYRLLPEWMDFNVVCCFVLYALADLDYVAVIERRRNAARYAGSHNYLWILFFALSTLASILLVAVCIGVGLWQRDDSVASRLAAAIYITVTVASLISLSGVLFGVVGLRILGVGDAQRVRPLSVVRKARLSIVAAVAVLAIAMEVGHAAATIAWAVVDDLRDGSLAPSIALGVYQLLFDWTLHAVILACVWKAERTVPIGHVPSREDDGGLDDILYARFIPSGSAGSGRNEVDLSSSMLHTSLPPSRGTIQ